MILTNLMVLFRAHSLTQLLWGLLVVNLTKGLAIFLLAYCVTILVKNLSSAQKHLIWCLVLISLMIVPVVWLLIPTNEIGIRIPVGASVVNRLVIAPFISRNQYMGLVEKSKEYTVLFNQAQSEVPFNSAFVMLGAWLLGMFALLFRLVAGRIGLGRLRTTANDDTKYRRLLVALTEQLAIKTEVTLLISEECGIPFTYGLIQPVIVLPADAVIWPSTRLRSVLIHELAHIKRKDYLTNSIANIICIFFWYIPLSWITYSFMLREEEKSCDSYVLNDGMPGTEYASDLVALVRSSQGHILLPSIYSTLGGKRMIGERIKNVISLRRSCFSSKSRRIGRILIVCFCCLFAFLSFTCITKPYVAKETEEIYGTWVNNDYKGVLLGPPIGGFLKLVIKSNGTWDGYDPKNPDAPSLTVPYTITDRWVDTEGNIWYKIHVKRRGIEWFELDRISGSGRVLEFVRESSEYPSEMDSEARSYHIYYRQM